MIIFNFVNARHSGLHTSQNYSIQTKWNDMYGLCCSTRPVALLAGQN